MPRAAMPLLVVAAALLLAPAWLPAAGLGGPPPCAVPDVAPGAPRVDAGPDAAVRIRFSLAQDLAGDFEVWFALRAHAAQSSWPAERALAAGFLETTGGESLAIISPQLGLYPYGAQADAGAGGLGGGLRVAAADGACWGAFGARTHLALPAGTHDLVVVGASEAGSRFAAILPPGASVLGAIPGPAALLSSETLPCEAKARAFAAGVLVEALRGCAAPLEAPGRAYRSLVATWGPDEEHDVRWVNPAGQAQRCYKAPGWCVDTGAGAAGAWTLEVAHYLTVRQPSPRLPGPSADYSGLFGVFAGRP